MAPIRVGLIGLAPIDEPYGSLGQWGVVSHLRPILASPHYELVAVCNSSVESAQKAIDFHRLGPHVKAYGSPDDLAKDPHIDLISVSVRVDKHLELSKPAIEAEKGLFVEWPLGASLAESEQLVKLAETAGIKTVVGLQLRADPLIAKTIELVASSIGTVTSSVASICSSVIPADLGTNGGEYLLDMKSGGNEFYIFFGHFLDAFTHVLGDFDSVQATLKTHTPTVKILDTATGEIVNPEYPRTAPDHIFVQGILKNGACVSVTQRKTPKAIDGLCLRWLITGTKGEVEVTIPESLLQFAKAGRKVSLKTFESAEIQTFEFGEEEGDLEHIASIAFPGANTAGIYEAHATGDAGKVATFAQALKTHRLLDDIARQSGFL